MWTVLARAWNDAVYRSYQRLDKAHAIRQLSGHELEDLAVVADDVPTRRSAARQARLARRIGIGAGVVYLGCGAAAAPNLLALIPSFIDWPGSLAPLAAGVLWAMLYAGSLGLIYTLVDAAQHGQSRWITRAELGVVSALLAVFTFEGWQRSTVPPGDALLPMALILAAWRAVAWATRLHARTMASLNEIAAQRQLLREGGYRPLLDADPVAAQSAIHLCPTCAPDGGFGDASVGVEYLCPGCSGIWQRPDEHPHPGTTGRLRIWRRPA